MNVSDHIRLSDLLAGISASNMDPAMKAVLTEVVNRLDTFIVSVITQLKAQPTLFTVNPATNAEDVEGAKAGDVAIYKNTQGDVEIEVFDD